jgi:hypothetical protein
MVTRGFFVSLGDVGWREVVYRPSRAQSRAQDRANSVSDGRRKVGYMLVKARRTEGYTFKQLKSLITAKTRSYFYHLLEERFSSHF